MTRAKTLCWGLVDMLLGGCGDAGDNAPHWSGRCHGKPRCPGSPVIDGEFTGWKDGCVEWPDEPICGTYGDLYVAYDDGTLWALNDWFLRSDAAIEPAMYNLFLIATDSDQFEIRVFGDQHIEVLQNGQPFAQVTTGAAGFHASPRHPEPHTIFEFALPLQATCAAMKERDPGPGQASSPEDILVSEPTAFTFALQANGVLTAAAATAPTLVSTKPVAAPAGAQVALVGSLLGQAGTVDLGGHAAEIVAWADEEVVAVVPDVPSGPYALRVVADGQTSNAVPFEVLCVPSCAGRQCGDDGCGGSCGSCAPPQTCAAGMCACQPSCAGKQCGPDGCGGSCGSCAAGKACLDNTCVCPPQCTGKQCGPDGCGGSCGSCAAGHACLGGKCVCQPDCAGKQCGPDGCAGWCGSCPPDQICGAKQQCVFGPK
ncbi:MAG: hypothetical protein HY744_19925 [Deltaproteobacteria bacterium]|nr:hypothetical protein [Deltaproteobacteria bacterium]